METRNDEKLVADYLKGDEQALRLLIERYLGPIYNFVYRYVGSEDAEDITQNVFVNIWKNIKKFDRNRKFKTWIFSIAKNASLDWLKKKKPLAFSDFQNEEGENLLAESIVDSSPLPEELFSQSDLNRKLSEVIKKLNPNYRIVLTLRYNDHFTFREIAETLGESLDTVKSRHRRALNTLKKFLTKS